MDKPKSTEWPSEDRIESIGQNGPSGDHYEDDAFRECERRINDRNLSADLRAANRGRQEQIEVLSADLVKARNEKDALAAQVADMQGYIEDAERDLNAREYELRAVRESEQALAAHVERLTSWIKENAWHRDDCDLLDLDEEGRHKACSCGLSSVYEAPETSLAKRDSEKQAEAFDELASDLALNADNARGNGYVAAADVMQDAADYALTKAEMRRQDGGDE